MSKKEDKKKSLNIDDLLNALKTSPTVKINGGLENTKETWRRIGEVDTTLAEELGVTIMDLDEAINKWIEDNPYHAITD